MNSAEAYKMTIVEYVLWRTRKIAITSAIAEACTFKAIDLIQEQLSSEISNAGFLDLSQRLPRSVGNVENSLSNANEFLRVHAEYSLQ